MDSATMDLVISGGTVWTPNGAERIDVGVQGGCIVALGDLTQVQATERFDATGLQVMPGVIDTQVHFREPGLTHKEDLNTGTAGAALGGVTAVFEMPNTNPSTLTAEDMAYKVARGRASAWTDFAFFMGAAAENVNELRELELTEGCCGVKIFMGSSTGSLLVDDPEVLEAVLRQGRRRVAVHCEDEARLTARKPLLDKPDVGPADHPYWRDEQTALIATKRLLEVAARVGRPVHVLHVTTAEEMAFLAQHKDICTVEVLPQHLTLTAPECYERLGTYAQMNPPIRSARHQEAIWAAVNSGVVDVLGSDHAPHTKEEKARPYPKSPSGMPGVQTMLPLMLEHVYQGKLSFERLIDLTSAGPLRIYNLRDKGRIALGYHADFTLVDLDAVRVIEEDWIASRCGWSPFVGDTIHGWPKATIIRGRIVMKDDELVGEPGGEPLRFWDV
ncbi:MAG: dihydroorotase [Cognaticolwellia sp.]|jgi:dihydroorotase